MVKKINILIVTAVLIFSYLNNIEGHKLFVSEKKTTAAILKTSTSLKTKSFESLYSNKKLGSFIQDGITYFRLFAPGAENVVLETFETPEQQTGKLYEMTKDSNGVWEALIEGEKNGLYYGYKVYHKNDLIKNGNHPLCVDPYAKAVTTLSTYLNPKKSIVYENNYSWGSDEWIQHDWRDLIIYEMHIRDLTADPSSGSHFPGSYQGLIEKDINGGLSYIKSLGVNTVELLPAMEFGTVEIPYEDSLDGFFNTWNPYERNHWGYMTSNFFAPESYYSENWTKFKRNEWMGKDGKQVEQFKNMVKAFHQNGIAVMMDVVFNHLSEYEIGNLKQIDKEYYFRLDKDGNCTSQSFCGNDLKTENPMVRRLIIDSILYWMKEYHIDGFRFDLGKLIDWVTIEDIIYEARKINPNVVFVCEPWGGGYDPKGFSLRGWGAWNDQIRNGIKGENPQNGLGWIFGHWYGNNNIERIKSYVRGTLIRDKFGLFQKSDHSVNYLESHDGYTLGDFIRIGTRELNPTKIIKNVDAEVKLTPLQLKLNKLAALFLFTSQGITMISEGQEFARSKVIPWNEEIPDNHKGHVDHNSYNKDNATNYLDFNHAEINEDLVDYYKGLISLRKANPVLRRAKYEDYHFLEVPNNKFALAFTVSEGTQKYFVAYNANHSKTAEFNLPEGIWEIVVDKDRAGNMPINEIQNKIELKPISGYVLKLK